MRCQDDGTVALDCRAPAENNDARSVIRQGHNAFIVGSMVATIFFPDAHAIGTTFNASRRCEFVRRSLRAAKIRRHDSKHCRERLAAQYLSDSHTAYDFVHDNEFERMIHCDLTTQFSQPFH